MLGLKSKLNKSMSDLLSNGAQIKELLGLSSGPLHLIMPENMDANVSDLRSVLQAAQVDHQIYFAHKPTKAMSFVKQALKLNLGLDVASRQELCNGLTAGFNGSKIECTGIKSNSFLQLALFHRCKIVVDSIPELHRIVAVKKALGLTDKVNIMLRLSEISIPGRNMNSRPSRFGIEKNDLNQALHFFEENKGVSLLGFHFHSDERENDIRAGQLEGLLHLTVEAYRKGLSPTMVNIGGGLRREQLASPNEWVDFVSDMEESLINNSYNLGWRNFAYGMKLNDRGKVIGRGQAIGLFPSNDFKGTLQEMLSSGDIDGKCSGDFMRENGFTLALEPGHALLDQCGISFFQVIEVKTGFDGNTFIVVDGNMYNLSTSMRDYIMDPILISQQSYQEKIEAFIVGSLCREEDFLMKRKIAFDKKPLSGDIIGFANTAAYRMDFENASPHLHSTGSKLVASWVGEKLNVTTEENFDPFNISVGSIQKHLAEKELVAALK